MKKRAADIAIEALIKNGVTNAFSVVGGGSMHLNNAFAIRKNDIKTVYNHHEQACAMAAESYARLTGGIAAVCVTSGPGGTNTLNGIHSAWVDSVPMIVLAGHPRYTTTTEYSGLDVRCIGVQENRIVEQMKSVTKYAKLITDPLSIRREVQYAIDIALDGRRGPVWLSVPLDVQGALVEEDELYDDIPFVSCLPKVTSDELDELCRAVGEAKRPCLLTGSGITTGSARKAYRRFTEFMDIPIVGGYTASDLNCLGDKNYYGMSGSFGQRCGNFILQNADFILVLGNSLGSSQTGYYVEGFAPSAKIYMVDAQKDEAKKPGLNIAKVINADLNDFFNAFCERGVHLSASDSWLAYCNYLKAELPAYEMLRMLPHSDGSRPVHPIELSEYLLKHAEPDAVFALGNSSCNDHLLLESLLSDRQRIIYNYKCGSMGMDLPYAIGALEGGVNRPVYCMTGDGCFMMNLQEMQTIRHYYNRLKLIIFNNNGYGDIRKTCSNYFSGMKNGCDPESGVSFPDFSKIADAFGFKFKKVSCVSELAEGVDWLIASDDNSLLEVLEIPNKKQAPVISSVMNEQGQFTTPPLHIMTPPLPRDVSEYMFSEDVDYKAAAESKEH